MRTIPLSVRCIMFLCSDGESWVYRIEHCYGTDKPHAVIDCEGVASEEPCECQQIEPGFFLVVLAPGDMARVERFDAEAFMHPDLCRVTH